MKTFVFTFALTVLTAALFGQNDTLKEKVSKKDTAVIKVNDKEIIIVEDKKDLNDKFDSYDTDDDHNIEINTCWNKKFDGHYSGFELGVNNYLNSDYEMSLPDGAGYLELDDSKSLEFNWNLADFAIPIIKHRLGLVTGLGFSWNNYKFDNKQNVLQNDSVRLYVVEETDVNYSKNKLTTWYMNVPVMLEVQQPIGSKTLWMAVGAYGGVKLGSHTKMVTNSGDKTKTRKDFHLNTLRYGVRAQVGLENFGFYCNYSLQSLFKKDEGPEVYPLSLGVSLAF